MPERSQPTYEGLKPSIRARFGKGREWTFPAYL